MFNYQTHRHFFCYFSTVMLYIDNYILQRFHSILQHFLLSRINIQWGFKVINFIICLVSYSFLLISEVLDFMRQITCLLFGIFIQPLVSSSFLGSRLSILLQLIFNFMGIDSTLFHHLPNFGYGRMFFKYFFGMILLLLSLLIKGSGSMFIIDSTDGFCCFPL